MQLFFLSDLQVIIYFRIVCFRDKLINQPTLFLCQITRESIVLAGDPTFPRILCQVVQDVAKQIGVLMEV